MIKAIIFDYGGVVGTHAIENVYFEIAKISGLSYEIVRNGFHKLKSAVQKGEISMKEFWENYATQLNIDANNLEQTWVNTFKKHTKKNEDVIKIIKALKAEYKIVLVTNTIKPFAEHHKKHGDYDIFHLVVISCDIGMRKPDEEIYKFTMEKLGVRAVECVFIDNQFENVKAAERIGMKAILFKNAEQLRKDLEKFGIRFSDKND